MDPVRKREPEDRKAMTRDSSAPFHAPSPARIFSEAEPLPGLQRPDPRKPRTGDQKDGQEVNIRLDIFLGFLPGFRCFRRSSRLKF